MCAYYCFIMQVWVGNDCSPMLFLSMQRILWLASVLSLIGRSSSSVGRNSIVSVLCQGNTILHGLSAKLWFSSSYFWNYYSPSGYDIENSSTLPINRRNTTAMPPSVAGVPSSYNPEATVQTRNESQVTGLPVPPVISHSSHSCSCFIYTHLVLLILFLAILWSFFFLLFFSHWNFDPSPVWSYSFLSSGLVYIRLLVSCHFFH